MNSRDSINQGIAYVNAERIRHKGSAEEARAEIIDEIKEITMPIRTALKRLLIKIIR